MSKGIEFRLNEATAPAIAEHLRCCESHFMPSLGERVDVDEYAEKIERLATRFEAWAGHDLVGLVAVYCNDPVGETAYVTSVSVVHGHQGLGIASQLLAQSIDFARQLGFTRISLEADRGNGAALDLYARAGFIVTSERDRMVHMDLEMREHGNAGGQA